MLTSVERSAALLVAVVLLSACRQLGPMKSVSIELGCGRGAYPSQPIVVRRATLPDPSLAASARAGLRVIAHDAHGGAAIASLRLTLTSRADNLTQATSTAGEAIFRPVADGPIHLDARLFDYLPSRDTLRTRAGFVDTVELRLGRMGRECHIVPDPAVRKRARG